MGLVGNAIANVLQVAGLGNYSRRIWNITGLPAGSVSDNPSQDRLDISLAGFELPPRGRCAPVRCVATGSIPQYSRTGSVITLVDPGVLSPATFDGCTLALGDRVLLGNDATGYWGTAADSWIYTVTRLGRASVAEQFTRATDADTSAKVYRGSSVRVLEGTLYAGHEFKLVTPCAVTLNTTLLLVQDIDDSAIPFTIAATSYSSAGVTVSIPMVDDSTIRLLALFLGRCTAGADAGARWGASHSAYYKRDTGVASVADVGGSGTTYSTRGGAFSAKTLVVTPNTSTGNLDLTFPGVDGDTMVFGGTVYYGREPNL